MYLYVSLYLYMYLYLYISVFLKVEQLGNLICQGCFRRVFDGAN